MKSFNTLGLRVGACVAHAPWGVRLSQPILLKSRFLTVSSGFYIVFMKIKGVEWCHEEFIRDPDEEEEEPEKKEGAKD